MTEAGNSGPRGIPVFSDDRNRLLVDPVAGAPSRTDWHPANRAAENLWRCLECLRDVRTLLHGRGLPVSEREARRCVKLLITPLFSFAEAVKTLIDHVEANPESRAKLSAEQVKVVVALKAQLIVALPIGPGGLLRRLRDKTGAHLDRQMSPREIQKLLMAADPGTVGAWLHQGMILLSGLLDFDIYAWSAGDCPAGYVKLMTCEPMLVTLAMDGTIARQIVGVEVSRSPKYELAQVIQEVARMTQWMFNLPTATGT